MSTIAESFERYKKVQRILSNSAINPQQNALALIAYNSSAANIASSAILMANNRLNEYLLEHQRNLDKLLSISPSMNHINAAALVPNSAWIAMQQQLQLITKLPEWNIIEEKLDPNIKIAEPEPLFDVIEPLELPSENLAAPKRRKRLAKKAAFKKYDSLTIGDLISLAGVFSTVYQNVQDENLKNHIGALLCIIYSIVVFANSQNENSDV